MSGEDAYARAQIEGLAERVARLEAQLAELLTGAGGGAAATPGPPDLRHARDEVIRILRGEGKIQAIKAHRELTGDGLKEAKDAVERLEREYRL